MKILVTGGCGFIGSHFIEEILKRTDIEKVNNIDCLTYAANKNLPFENDKRYTHHQFDITDPNIDTIKLNEINYVIHFAAESHVDNSITGPDKFINTNIFGTFNLLKWIKELDFGKFIHVSTDEVFGSLNPEDAPFNIDSPYKPNSPYAASKASSDLLVRSYYKTYKFPAIITNCSNNFGPRQFPEKLIPLTIDRLKKQESIPVYGNGQNVRDWIYVKDHVNMLINIMLDGKVGGQYLIGGDNEISNINLIETLVKKYRQISKNEVKSDYIKFVEDRKGHDIRYAIDNTDLSRIFTNFKFTNFEDALETTIKSYL